MDKDVDLANTALSFPDVESGSDIEAGPNIICITCHDDCTKCQDTCIKCQGTCEKSICG